MAKKYTLGENRYPDTVEKVMAILNGYKMAQPMQHKVALTQINKHRKGSDAHPDAKPGLDGIIHVGINCHMCSNIGHYASK